MESGERMHGKGKSMIVKSKDCKGNPFRGAEDDDLVTDSLKAACALGNLVTQL